MLEPLIPMGRRGVKPRRNREVISGIVHVLKVGCRWRDCPEVYGPHTTIYNRFHRWSKAGIWQTMLEALVDPGSTESQSLDKYHLQGTSLRRRGKRGAQEQAIGRSRGGRTAIHAVANASVV